MSDKKVLRVKLVRLTEEEIKAYENRDESESNESPQSLPRSNDDNFLESVPGTSSQTYEEAARNESNRQRRAKELEEEKIRQRLVLTILRNPRLPIEFLDEEPEIVHPQQPLEICINNSTPKPLAEQTSEEYEKSFGQLTRIIRKKHPMCPWHAIVENESEKILEAVYKIDLHRAKQLSLIRPLHKDVLERRNREQQKRRKEMEGLVCGNPFGLILPEKRKLKKKETSKNMEKRKRREAVIKAYEREEMIRKLKRAKHHWNQKRHNDGRIKAIEKKSKNLLSKTRKNADTDPEFSIRTHQSYGKARKILKQKTCSLQAFNSVWGKKRF